MNHPDEELRKVVALFRYGLIADVLRVPLGSREIRRTLHEKAQRSCTTPNPCRRRPILRLTPGLCPASPAIAISRWTALRHQSGRREQRASLRRPPGRTSRAELPAGSPGRRHTECRARERRLPSSRHHEPAPRCQTRGAPDREAAKCRSYGRSVASFYNVERPHSALDGRTPAEACGYDGQAAARLAHIPTGATAATGRSTQGDAGGLRRTGIHLGSAARLSEKARPLQTNRNGAHMLPVYVINLDRRPDRWATISENLARLDLAAERITAVDARALPPQSAKIDLGAVACARSHAIAMTRLLDSSAPAALILEDDVEVGTDTPALLESTDWWPPGAKVVRLEVQGKHPQQLWRRGGQTPTGRALHKLERWGNCAGAYLINRHCLNPVMPQDHILFDHRISLLARALRTFQIVPGRHRRNRTPTCTATAKRPSCED